MRKTIAKIKKHWKLFLWEDKQNWQTNSQSYHKKGERLTSIKSGAGGGGEFTTGSTEMQRIIRDYYNQLYANKMDNLEEMTKFFKKYNLPKLKQEGTGNMNRPTTNT